MAATASDATIPMPADGDSCDPHDSGGLTRCASDRAETTVLRGVAHDPRDAGWVRDHEPHDEHS